MLTLGSGAFQRCTTLTRVDLPESLTHIDCNGATLFSSTPNAVVYVVESSYAHTWCTQNNVSFVVKDAQTL